MKRKVLIALSSFGEYDSEPLKILRASGFQILRNTTGRRLNRDEIIELGSDVEGIIAGVEPYDSVVLAGLKKVRCISRCVVGLDNIDLNEAKKRKLTILNTPDVVVQPVAELTVAMIFDLLRKLTQQTALLKTGRWEKKAGHLLQGKTIGILGLGRIGKRVAEILFKLETQVIGADLFPDKVWAIKYGVNIVTAQNLLKISDIVSIHLATVDKNSFQLGAKEIAMMKKGALLVNTSRGQFVDEEALYNTLKSGRLAGAALDVFIKEPYSGKLCELNNVVLTPHIGTLTEESRAQMELEAAQNLINFFNK